MAKNEIENDMKERKPKIRIVLSLFLIISLLTSAFAIYEIFLLSSIETLLRYIVIGVLLIIDIVLFIKVRICSKKRKKKHKKKIGLVLFMVLYSILCFIVGFAISYIYGRLDSINKDYVTYTSDLVVMSDNDAKSIDDIKDYTIGILNDKSSPDGYIIPQEMIDDNKLEDDNEIKKYDDYSTMLVDLYAGEVDAVFITDNYVDMFSNITGYEDVATDTRIIISKDKKMKKSDTSEEELSSSGKEITEPFTLLLMGIDSTDEVLSKNAIANGDTLILITFNPKTLNATMVSIPRDSYVPIACWSDKAENKITHAAGYGTDCMMQTIENYFGINIDYYAKINLNAVKEAVDSVGGIEFDVPVDMAYDDPYKDLHINLKKGRQFLNGEQVCSLLQFRKNNDGTGYSDGDLSRIKVSQEFIKELFNQKFNKDNLDKAADIYKTLSGNIESNCSIADFSNIISVLNDTLDNGISFATVPGENVINDKYMFFYEIDDAKLNETFKELGFLTNK